MWQLRNKSHPLRTKTLVAAGITIRVVVK